MPPVLRDGISFHNIAYINPLVDGKSLFEENDIDKSKGEPVF